MWSLRAGTAAHDGTQPSGSEALSLTELDWAGVELRKDMCDAIRRCDGGVGSTWLHIGEDVRFTTAGYNSMLQSDATLQPGVWIHKAWGNQRVMISIRMAWAGDQEIL